MQQIRSALTALLIVWGVVMTAPSFAQTPLRLVANPLPTLVSEESENARLTQLISMAFSEIGVDAELIVDRPAFSGSGLLTGRYDGEFAHFSLQERRDNLLYSKAYLPSLLYVGSRKHSLNEITQFSHLRNARVATTNRIANTPDMRRIKSVSWVRNPTLFDMFSQLAQQRADYVFEDWLVLAEFNRMLSDDGEQPLFVSPYPLVSASITLSVRKDIPDAVKILNDFDNYIDRIQQNGQFNVVMALSWTRKDINADGVADWITHSDIHHNGTPPMSQKGVLPLDKTQPGDASLFVIDGTIYSDWPAASAALNKQPALPRTTLLDHEVYKQMLQRW